MSETTAQALTDERIEYVTEIVRECAADRRCIMPNVDLIDAWLAAVEARAARRERHLLWRVIDPLMDGATDDEIADRIASVGAVDATLARAYRLGVSTALMEIAKGSDHA